MFVGEVLVVGRDGAVGGVGVRSMETRAVGVVGSGLGMPIKAVV